MNFKIIVDLLCLLLLYVHVKLCCFKCAQMTELSCNRDSQLRVS